ncbi:bifunctional diaminohydroxyphosphoribosylaminopyrimidine deaminase/5-amino-6-(5-phosphoribosylamino)uracil reductase RibD [Saxibacter everestensis]|uniref:Riboflavin biosynthesis protein RibD n=1 Tax=Saxibacter everestensis TaxID=2909229 RepID=A0ABY8QZ13_9MICO|nr:bifunctional diaminohydroxyphosphoribosylaminopyrimidine deaminase/5-amino-6-(5-phosphoribosylamino)uracil reductase RibD [Brevibacteriaceae bacterium ZFBP1038]
MTTDAAAMTRAIELSLLGANGCAPNPRVGAVILDPHGDIVGEGWHERPGEPHAEVHALRAAGDRARGGTAIVTLEPCNHHGRTPPCSATLLEAGIARVVYAVADPTSDAQGGGASLAGNGIDISSGMHERAARAANQEWLTAVARRRVHLTYKAAMTIDGRIAAEDGTSQWISSASSRADVHRLRGQADVVIAGRGSVLLDGARLTARDAAGRLLDHQPLRVVVDSQGRTPPDAPVRNDDAPTLIATTAEFGAGDDGRVDLESLSRVLFDRGHRGALLEGGATLGSAFLRAGLVDRLILYVAPLMLGSGTSVINDLGLHTLADATRWQLDDTTILGGDVRLSYTLEDK